MKLSIVVPVYNMAAGGKLNFCLDSLVNQTLAKTEYEIIAVDDASTDNSLAILKEYATRYPGLFKVLAHDVNKRQGGAKNTGIEAATGEWLGFIDSDDWVRSDYYEKLLEKARETGADMVGCDYSLVNSHTFEVGTVIKNNTDKQTGILDEAHHRELFLRPGSMVIKIYKKDIIDKNKLRFPEGIFYEDNCAGPVWSAYFTRFERVDEPMYYYYQHDTSTVHSITLDKCHDRMKAQEVFLEEMKARELLNTYSEETEFKFAELFYVNTLFTYMQGVKNPKLSFVKELRAKTKEHFPGYLDNKYLNREVVGENMALLKLQSKSDLQFFVYYRLKLIWRKFRKKLGI